ncbi:DUF6232 family protein [Amorphoplanes digitatis]|uniref:Uncharacterized protein n=1 Tax=Actinoplanes digitatis TaxID=1868 RepID=A0A7W7I5P2_9ACTN|nr:DUF6232 family protein [Actinoplanes digitatis]MBB4766903.1 hypothetical protein [Actinoplanes digitatis]BFE77125.1 hypothetical protein GCM10020092_104260 [Actinoplanes digitatis]GID95439.1 hypothetical protein Adi01nite_48510 [Actinoplanes digitatis]
MRTYYRGPDAVVTTDIFVGNGAPRTKFAVRDLRNVCITHTDEEHLRPSAARSAVGLLTIALATVPLWLASPLLALTVIALGIPATAAAAMFWRLRPQRWELRATYRGTEVTLYTSADERVFNQVSRALRRAIENSRPPALWDDLAAA